MVWCGNRPTWVSCSHKDSKAILWEKVVLNRWFWEQLGIKWCYQLHGFPKEIKTQHEEFKVIKLSHNTNYIWKWPYPVPWVQTQLLKDFFQWLSVPSHLRPFSSFGLICFLYSIVMSSLHQELFRGKLFYVWISFQVTFVCHNSSIFEQVFRLALYFL